MALVRPTEALRWGLLAGCALLSACAPPEPVDDGTLRLWKATHGETVQDWDALLAPFEAQHGVDVIPLAHPWGGWDERYTAAFTGGRPPDVAYMPDEFWPRYAAAGRLARLDSLFPEATARLASEFPDNLWQLGRLDGGHYGVPYLYTSWQLYYNRDLFEATGVAPPPRLPDSPGVDDWTWERFLETAQALTRDSDGDGAVDQWGFAWTVLGENPNPVYPFLWQGGADLLNEARDGNGFVEAGRAGLRFMQRLAEMGVVPEGGLHPDPADLFFRGRAGMVMTASSTIRSLRDDFPDLPVEAGIVPRGPATDFYEGRGSFGNTGFWVVAEASPRPDLAFELVRFLSERAAVQRMMEIVGLFGARLDWAPPPGEPLFATFLAGRRYIVPYPLHPRLRLVHSAILAEVQAMMLGHKSVDDALRHAGAEVDALVWRP